MVLRSTLVFASLGLAGCSLLAPSDDELLGGAQDAGIGAAGSGGTGGGNTGGAGTGGMGGAGTGGSATGGSAGAPTGGTSSGGTGGTSSGGTGGTSSGGIGGIGGTGGIGGGSLGGTGGTGGTTCVPKSGDATALPRAMYLFVDRSASMSDQNKFNYAEQGINGFVGGSKAAAIDFGMQFFGLETGGTCAGGGYSTPAVGFGPLPGLSSQISGSLAAATLLGATPLEGVANGSKLAGTQYLASKPTVQFDVVMITDLNITSTGGGCAANPSVSIAVVASTWPQMSTHVIALPNSSASIVDPLAAAGGTVAAQSATTPPTITAALNRTATPCRFSLPSGVNSGQISLQLVTANAPAPLTKRASSSACGIDEGWFDHAGGLVLCPVSCQSLAASNTGKITYTTTCP